MRFEREAPEFRAYKKVLFYHLIWWQGRQLTTGHRSTCPTTYGEYCDGYCTPIDQEPACSCRYGLFRVPGAPGPWVFTHRPGIRRPEALTAAFRIDPACPHHGDHR